LRFGVCLGNSGVPGEVKESTVIPGSVAWEFDETIRSGRKDYGRFSYASLEFSNSYPNEARLTFFNPDRKVVKEAVIYNKPV
jgi:hypothetical protein